MAARQGALLDRFSSLVRPGGRLVYATCSLFADENESVVEAFLARNRSFRWARRDAAGPSEFPAHMRTSRFAEVVMLPHRDGVEGFYVALLEREGGSMRRR